MGDLILLRHGETEWSLAGQHTGRTDIPLTPQGEAAAAKLAPLLARRRMVAAFTSPARRAVSTAALAGLAHAKPDPDLWEWDYGGYEGRTTRQIQEARPGWYLWRDRGTGRRAGRPGAPPGHAAAGRRRRRAGRPRAHAARAHRPLPEPGADRRPDVPAGHRDAEHARHRARRAGHHLLERPALAVAGAFCRAPWRHRPVIHPKLTRSSQKSSRSASPKIAMSSPRAWRRL